MSIARTISTDIRAYADTALAQGKQVGQKATTLATSTVADLRQQAEKTLNLEAIKSAVEPYLAQAKEYRNTVTDQAFGLVGSVTGDKRVAKLVDTVTDTAETVVGTVTDAVQDRVVKPVQNLTGRGKPATRKPSSTKPAATRPAPKPAAKSSTKSTAARTSTSRTTKSATASAAKKSPAKSTAKKASAAKASTAKS